MERPDLAALQAFLTIADKGSLRAAARHLGVNPPAVSSQLKSFEKRIGTSLFLRSTRSVALTDAGRALYGQTKHLLDGLNGALSNVKNASHARAGQLRITLSFRAWQLFIAPRLDAFHANFPDITLDLAIEEQLTDIVARGFHAGIRLGDHLQSEMIAVRFSQHEKEAYVASPAYLARCGTPVAPQDLLNHCCIRYRHLSSDKIADWHFNTSDGEVSVDAKGNLIFNDLRTVVDAAIRGQGIGWSLRRAVEQELATGTLVQVLEEFTPVRPGFSLYFPKQLQRLGILRVFIEYFCKT